RSRHTGFSRDWSSDVCSSDLHCRQGDALVEPHQAAAILDGQCQQIDIGELTWPVHVTVLEVRCIQHADVVIPEAVMWSGPGVVGSEERRVGKGGSWRSSRGRE